MPLPLGSGCELPQLTRVGKSCEVAAVQSGVGANGCEALAFCRRKRAFGAFEKADETKGALDIVDESGSKTKSKKKIWIIVGVLVAVIAAIAGGAVWYTQVRVPHQDALAEYESAVLAYDEAAAGLTAKNDALTSQIEELEGLTNSGQPPLDPDLLQGSGSVIGQAQAAIVDVPPLTVSIEEAEAASLEEINMFTSELTTIVADINAVEPHDAQIAQIAEAMTALSDSIAQMAQVTNPTEQFVIDRLTGLPNITGVQAATEDHDPNGQLHKQGGYTSAVFFSSDLVDRSRLFEEGDIVAVGTDGGGSVEVYETVEGAETRNEYLAAFDGSIINSGSHYVVGSCVVRVSSLLTASQQQVIQESIVESLIRLD